MYSAGSGGAQRAFCLRERCAGGSDVVYHYADPPFDKLGVNNLHGVFYISEPLGPRQALLGFCVNYSLQSVWSVFKNRRPYFALRASKGKQSCFTKQLCLIMSALAAAGFVHRYGHQEGGPELLGRHRQ